MQMQTSAFNSPTFLLLGGFLQPFGRFAPYVGQDAHFAPLQNFAFYTTTRNITDASCVMHCDALCVERTLNGLSDHAFKLPKRTIINQMCAIERWGGRFASLHSTGRVFGYK